MGTIEKDEAAAPSKPAPAKTAGDKESKPSKTSQMFFFADSGWRAKPAVAYVEEFIDVCESFIWEAESNFP
jgi:hypothetical protein